MTRTEDDTDTDRDAPAGLPDLDVPHPPRYAGRRTNRSIVYPGVACYTLTRADSVWTVEVVWHAGEDPDAPLYPVRVPDEQAALDWITQHAKAVWAAEVARCAALQAWIIDVTIRVQLKADAPKTAPRWAAAAMRKHGACRAGATVTEADREVVFTHRVRSTLPPQLRNASLFYRHGVRQVTEHLNRYIDTVEAEEVVTPVVGVAPGVEWPHCPVASRD